MKLAGFMAPCRAAHCRVEPLLESLWNFHLPGPQPPHTRRRNLTEWVIHGVNSRAGHNPESEQRFFLPVGHDAGWLTGGSI
jgi:hypothetical protein